MRPNVYMQHQNKDADISSQNWRSESAVYKSTDAGAIWKNYERLTKS